MELSSWNDRAIPCSSYWRAAVETSLIRQIEFLKAENEMLRKRVPKETIHLKPDEKARLIKLGQAVGPPIRQLISIVKYACFCTWINKAWRRLVENSTSCRV